MTLPNIYWRGGEDIDYVLGNGSGLDGTAGRFRSGYSRVGIIPAGANVSTPTNAVPWNGGTGVTSFWFSTYIFTIATGSNNWNVLYFYDSAGVLRYFINSTGTAGQYVFYKRNAAGTNTALGSAWLGNIAGNTFVKWDFQIVGGTSGSVTGWSTSNGTVSQMFTFSGDTTTDGVTPAITHHALGNPLNGNGQWVWSEQIVSDSDTRSMSLVTLVPAANGNTHNFDTGSPAAANINEITVNQTTIDGSSTAGQIDEYTINGLPTGTFSILDVGITAQLQKGFSGPSKMDLGVRCGGTPADYWSSDQVLTTSWATYINDWQTDPSTSAPWAGLPVNIGLKSVT